ncbi:MAG: hypothetical protein HN969_09075 [Verrucomicrobia bacterium]|jgi:hypothetical protein|nr:hypothetical protein [Verrucomicrobiota bacterium]MBT3912896.1 hypothetical protein [Verrucomicrobiota bacterium]MBT4901240.1 hypothetical protein [Verrucomicrobiota bacterium]MBT7027696.1 hypothetical protein [Verrucomicrobiota bacterium]
MKAVRFIQKYVNRITLGFSTSQTMKNHRLIAFKLQTSMMIMTVALQIAPLARTLVTTARQVAPSFAVVLKWGIGTATLMGGYDAVSGASTKITSPSAATGTVGEPFLYRITTAPKSAKIFTAVPLPEGLMMGMGNFKSYVMGTPTVAGTTVIKLTASKKKYKAITKNLILTIGAPPTITASPLSRTVAPGASVQFKVTATGSKPLLYQWLYFGKPIPGATADSLSVPDSKTKNSGEYSVTVSNGSGSVESKIAYLTVNGPPAILVPPISSDFQFGKSASLNVQATGFAPLSYQWFFDGEKIAGATEANLSFDVVDGSRAGVYRVTVSNERGTVESQDIDVTIDYGIKRVNEAFVSMEEIWRFNQSGSDLGTAWRMPGFNDAGWKKGGGLLYVEGSSLPAIKKTRLAIGKRTYYFRSTFDNPYDTAAVALQMETIIDDGAVFYLNGHEVHRLGMPDGSVNYNTKAERTVSNAELEGPFTISSNHLKTGENVMTVEVHQSSGSSTDIVFGLSLDAVVSIPNTPPMITGSPADLSLNQGGTVVFQVEASGTETLRYQWRLNGQLVPGATAAKLPITNVQLDQSGAYTVTVSNAFGDATSAPANLVVNIPVSIHSLPPNQTAVAGESVIFKVTASGTEPLSYQWQFNGTDISGANNPELELAEVQPDQAGVYTVTVNNEAGTVASSPISLVVNPSTPDAPAPEISRVQLVGGRLHMYFATVKGRDYRVDARASLSGGGWTAVSTMAGSGGEVSFSASVAGDGRNFYRVVLLE